MGMRCRLRKQPGDDNLISSYVFIVAMSVIICVTCITGHNPIIPVIVSGKSMESSLHNNDRGFVFRFGKINHYDIITFDAIIDGKPDILIKRVIGLPGDSVKCIGKTVYVNGDPIVEFAKDPNYNTDFEEVHVPDNCYFVLGDNREVSLDSRYDEVGFVESDTIQGIFHLAK